MPLSRLQIRVLPKRCQRKSLRSMRFSNRTKLVIYTENFSMGIQRNGIADADFIVVSPGVPLNIPILRDAQAQGLPILGELEVAASVCPAPIVAITGTKGKSTTTLLTAAILKAGSKFPNICVAGNIGVPLAAEVQKLTSKDIVVVEASSFQLESTVAFHPRVSVVLNLSRESPRST